MADEDIPEWVRAQKRTFTRWCNERLKERNIVVYDLATDLSDGLKLIALYEVLAKKRVDISNKKATSLIHRTVNIAFALKCIENDNIKLVNIHAENIAKGNLTEILGLIWTLILRYQISMAEFEDYNGKGSKMTPKQALLIWVKSKMPPEIPMNNFTTDWNDGRAIACLVDAVEPGLFPDVDPEDLDPNEAVNNTQKAMETAEKYLGVPHILEAADMCNPKVEEIIIMTYISFFRGAKCRSDAPHRRHVPAWAKWSAEGPGITSEGLVVNQLARFTVFTAGADEDSPQVNVLLPDRSNIPCEVIDNGNKTFSCKYIPPEQGIYDVHIKWKGRYIPKSPFRVMVSSDQQTSDDEDSVKPSVKNAPVEKPPVKPPEVKKQKSLMDLFMFDVGTDSTSFDPYLLYTIWGS